jgi:GntR family transcriptional repressor for pyruvate dehydrogenase complex
VGSQRLIPEGNLAAFAAERGKEEDHAALAEEVAAMFAEVGNPTEYLIHDVLFHRIISRVSGNPVLATLMETITSALYDKRCRTVEYSFDLRESAEIDRGIYRAIRARKPIDAHRLMGQHQRMAEAAQGMERLAERKPARGNGKCANGHGAKPTQP